MKNLLNNQFGKNLIISKHDYLIKEWLEENPKFKTKDLCKVITIYIEPSKLYDKILGARFENIIVLDNEYLNSRNNLNYLKSRLAEGGEILE